VEFTTAEGRTVVVEAGDNKLKLEGREIPLPVAPRLGGRYLYAPLSALFTALGARVRESAAQGAFSAAAVLRQVQFLRGQDSVVVRLVTSAPITGSLHRMADPPRVYVDVRGLALDPQEGEHYLGAGGAWRLRWSQIDSGSATARFVVDLCAPRSACWVAAADGGRLEVGTISGAEQVFLPERPRLESVELVNQPGESGRVVVRLSAPAEFSWEITRRPYDLLLSLPDVVAASLTRTAEPNAVIRGVEVRPRGAHGAEVAVRLGWVMRFSMCADPAGREITVVLQRGVLAGKRIVIDPGHGGRDPGAQARGLNEKDINLAVATALAARLGAAGAIVLMTRDSDVYVPLADRPRLATAVGADAFVSVHCNAMERANRNYGTEAYFYTPQSRLLADMLQDSLVAGLGRRDNGVRQRRFAVLWRSQQPCALVELMYLDWDAEGDLLRRPEVQEQAAEALFRAIQGYFEGVALSPEGSWPVGPPLLMATGGEKKEAGAVLNAAPAMGTEER
jgi:N-acetylmuramoyl-L-alanine amidase